MELTKGLRDCSDAGLRDLLLRIAAFGLYAYSLFGVIAGALQLHSTQHIFVLVTNVLTIVQVRSHAGLFKLFHSQTHLVATLGHIANPLHLGRSLSQTPWTKATRTTADYLPTDQ